MAKLITKRSITILNLALLAVFLITLGVVAIPFVKKEPRPTLFSDTPRRSPREPVAVPEAQETYTCPKHPDVTSTSPGKCPQCGSELETVNRYAAIVKRDLFYDPALRPTKVVVAPAPPPLQWVLVGVTEVNREYVAIIRDKAKRVLGGFAEYDVREGDQEVGDYFGVTILNITPDPPSVTYERAGVGVQELKMGEPGAMAAGAEQEEWADVIIPVRAGYMYGVKYSELQRRIPSAEAYRESSGIGLEPNREGARITGVKITTLPHGNLLYTAGLRQGDVIESINGAPITDEAAAFAQLQSSAAKGFTIDLVIGRGTIKRKMVYTLHKK